MKLKLVRVSIGETPSNREIESRKMRQMIKKEMTLLSESKSNTTRGWNKVFKVYFIKKPLEEPITVRGSECVKYLKGQKLE